MLILPQTVTHCPHFLVKKFPIEHRLPVTACQDVGALVVLIQTTQRHQDQLDMEPRVPKLLRGKLQTIPCRAETICPQVYILSDEPNKYVAL